MVELAKGLVGRANPVVYILPWIVGVVDHRPEVAKSGHLFNCVAVDGHVKRLERVGRMGLCQDFRLSNVDLQACTLICFHKSISRLL